MREIGLVNRLVEPTVGGPAVADQDAIELGAERRGCLVEAAPVLDGVDGRRGRDKGPQPVQPRGDFPAGFIRRDDRTPAHLLAQAVVGRLRATGRSLHRLHHAARRDPQAEAFTQQGRDLADREAQLLVEHRGQRHRLRAELRACGPERVGRLQGVASLDPPATSRAPTDVDVKRPHNGSHDRQVFLILTGDADPTDARATMRTFARQRRLILLIHACRNCAMRRAAVRGPCLASRAFRRGGRRALGERRCLPKARTARRVEFIFQPIDLLAQALALPTPPSTFAFQPLEVASLSFDLPLLSFELLQQVLARGGSPARSHLLVRPYRRGKYKYEKLDLSRGGRAAVTLTR